MRLAALKYSVLSVVSILTMIIILLVPFHGFLTVWLSNLVGHYTVIRLWDEVLLLICIIGAAYLLITDHKIRLDTLSKRLVWLIYIYVFLSIILGIIAYFNHSLTKKALGYGLIVNLRYLLFFLVTWTVAIRLKRVKRNYSKLVIWPAVVVIIFGLAQIFILPHDFLKHFGYGPDKIPVLETINNNPKYVRFASTLRGANPLGAYLIIPISLLTVLLLKTKRKVPYVWILAGSLILLFYTFSRSAWIGVILSLGLILFASKLNKNAQKILLASASVVILLGAGLVLSLHNSTTFQNFALHTQKNSKVSTTSNEFHLTDLKIGIKDVTKHPIGGGPGSAGPASIYNKGNSKIAENYYIQIAQETGWLGFILFILINAIVGYNLWLKRRDPLALSLLASLFGITFINLLSHAWSDDTLSYIWWGLAGLTMVSEKTLKKVNA